MLLKLGIAGYSGRIGQRLKALIENSSEYSISCRLVSPNSQCNDKNRDEVCQISDIWIDFSTPSAFDKVLSHCIETKTPLVSGTTGLSQQQFLNIEKAGKYIPILWTSNFSISINLIQQLLSKYSRLNNCMVNISETHHIHKADKPSGTAISLARSIKPHGILKTTSTDKFDLDGININSIREAEIAGIHNIDLENESEQITISHSAKTPQIFAQGALDVAKWLINKKAGYYTMNDYIASLN